MTTQTLHQLGFSQKEIQIYLLLLQHGRMAPAELAKLTGISRPTVYSVAKGLVKKGMVLEDLGGKSRTFIPRPPEDLVILANRESQALEKKKELIARATQELRSVALSDKYQIPKIVFIPEENVEAYLFSQTPIWNASILSRDNLYWGFQDHTLVEVYEKWIDWYWLGSPTAISVRLLSNASDIEKRMQKKGFQRRNIRFWDKASNFTATTWIMGDYVALIHTRSHPYSLVEIHDQAFAENLRQIFKGIWESI